jgi:RNA polymerase sigma-70 factor (ECF subfamily)
VTLLPRAIRQRRDLPPPEDQALPDHTGTPRGASAPRLFEPDRERSLRARLAARDQQALAELVEKATPWLLNVALAMLQDQDEAEEVVMEAVLALWQNVSPPTEDATGLMPYLLRVTRHRAIDRIRRRQRRKRKHAVVAAEQEGRSIPPDEPNEAARPGWHVHAQVHSALAALPADQQAVVRLAYFKGMTQSEISERLGIPLGTVKTRLRLAFGHLRTALAGLKDWVL